MTTTTIKYNPPVDLGRKLESINVDSLPNFFGRDLSWLEALTQAPWISNYLQHLKLEGNHKWVTVKIAIDDYRVGQSTCQMPLFHCDSTPNALNPATPEVHHLICCDRAPTEFIATPIEMNANLKYAEQVKLLSTLEFTTVRVPAWTWVTYGRLNFHRGPKVEQAGKRMFIRVSESDINRPKPYLLGS
jgi:hypothetical protein